MKLTSTQQNAVNELVNEFNPNNKNIVYFKAPTGSGKTFMIANVINDITKKYFGEKLLFVIATLSSAELPKQMENNLNDYKHYLDFGAYLNIEKVDSPSNSKTSNKSDATYAIIAEKNKVLIFGTSSFGKNKIFTEEGVFDAFIDQIKNEEYKLVYMKIDKLYKDMDSVLLYLEVFVFCFFFFWPYLQHAEVPRPGIKPKPPQWQHQILNQ